MLALAAIALPSGPGSTMAQTVDPVQDAPPGDGPRGTSGEAREALGGGGFVVQVAALSSPERAAMLAKQLGGHVTVAGKLYRVHLGPFADMASARQARDGVTRKGYTNAIIHATILHVE